MLLPENRIMEIYGLTDDICKFYSETVKNNALEEHNRKRLRNKPNSLPNVEAITIYFLRQMLFCLFLQKH